MRFNISIFLIIVSLLYYANSRTLKGKDRKNNALNSVIESRNKLHQTRPHKSFSQLKSCSNRCEYSCGCECCGENNGNETGNGSGNGSETGNGNGNGSETGNGNGNGGETGNGNGNGGETGNGNGNGGETGNGNGNGSGSSGSNHERKTPKEILEEHKNRKEGLIAGYYGSWNSQGDRRKLMTDSNPMTSIIYVSFARINIFYDISRPFDTRQKFLHLKHGLEFETYAVMINEIRRIRRARPDIIVLISLGGETYMIDIEKEIDYAERIAKFVDDFDLDGVDIDWEPNGSFNNLNEIVYSNYYIKLVSLIREKIPDYKLISVSGSSNAALSCIGIGETFCKDEGSPYNSKFLLDQTEANQELYNAANMLSAGTFINIFNTLKDKINLVFIQTYNLETSNPSIMADMYLSHLYYGLKYDITVILGFSLEQNRGGFSPENKELLELVGKTIHEENHKNNRADGVGVWHLFMVEQDSKAYDVDAFINNMWAHINPGVSAPKDINVVQNPEDCDSIDKYTPGLVIPSQGSYFKHNDCIWRNKYYSTTAPGIDRYEWELIKVCYEKACNGQASHYYNTDYETNSIVIWKGEAFRINWWQGGPPEGSSLEAYTKLEPSECPGLEEWNKKYPHRPLEVEEPYEQEQDFKN